MSATQFLNICAISSGVFWTLTYVTVIWRGFKDRSVAMPMVALSANISWEGIFSFIYLPPSSLLHTVSIVWFCFDIPIALQCFLYGEKDTKHEFTKKYFRVIFLVAIVIAFLILFKFIPEFKDVKGVYVGYGINLMMSILFVDMFFRRDEIRGQSIYIAIGKWLGSLCAFFTSSFQSFGLTADLNIPLNIEVFLKAILSTQTYPLTPLVRVLYSSIFIFDVFYVILLYHKYKEQKLNPWTRI
jgi:hypothetical protein